jgi:hypothetical protein
MVISIYDTSREGTPEQFDKKRAREVRESLSLSLEDLTSIFSSKKQGRKIIIRTLNEYENGDKSPYSSKKIDNPRNLEQKYLVWLAKNGYDPFRILLG